MKRTKNLRLDDHPYPHLRDDEGCVLASDYIHLEKLDFILTAIRKFEHEHDKSEK